MPTNWKEQLAPFHGPDLALLSFFLWCCVRYIKLRGLSMQANYTDQATAAVGKVVPTFVGREGVTWSAQWIPTAVNLIFLDRIRYFFFQVAHQL
jgi:hypothetical protein